VHKPAQVAKNMFSWDFWFMQNWFFGKSLQFEWTEGGLEVQNV